MLVAHLDPLAASMFSLMAIVSLMLAFVMLGSRWLNNYLYAFAAESWVIAALSAAVGILRRLSRTLSDRDPDRAVPRACCCPIWSRASSAGSTWRAKSMKSCSRVPRSVVGALAVVFALVVS